MRVLVFVAAVALAAAAAAGAVWLAWRIEDPLLERDRDFMPSWPPRWEGSE